jgi:hypothetical protein
VLDARWDVVHAGGTPVGLKIPGVPDPARGGVRDSRDRQRFAGVV